MQLAVTVCLVAVLSFSLAAMGAALLGTFQPLQVLVGGVVLTAAGLFAARKRIPSRRGVAPHVTAVLAIAVAVAAAAWNVHFAAEPLLVDRDAGGYVVTGQLMGHSGVLTFSGNPAAFGNAPGLTYGGAGFSTSTPGGPLYAERFHLFPALLAIGYWLAGDQGLIAANAVLGGLALVMVYAFASTVVRPVLALAVMTALAASLPEAYFARTQYSEIVTQLLLFGGFWMAWRAFAVRRPSTALVAGLLLGATVMARLDSLLFMVAIGVFVFIAVLTNDGRVRAPRRLTTIGALVVGAAVGIGLGVADGLQFSPHYIESNSSFLRLLGEGAGALAAVLVVVTLLRPLIRRVAVVLVVAQAIAAGVLPAAFAAAGVYAFVFRPHLEYATFSPATDTLADYGRYTAALQLSEGVFVDGTRTYAEQSMLWIGWYLGPVVVGLAILGLAIMLARLLRGRMHAGAQLFLLIFLISAGLYFWNPIILPADQIWVMRRFVPVILPGILVLAGYSLEMVLGLKLVGARASDLTDRVIGVGRTVLVGAGMAALAVPAALTTAPLAMETSQAGMVDLTQRVCAQLPPDASALIMNNDTQALGLTFSSTVRSYCGVDAAIAPPRVDYGYLTAMANSARRAKRTLVIITGNTTPIPGAPPTVTAKLVGRIAWSEPERTFERPPARTTTHHTVIYIIRL
jgi:hypothetical protein